MYHLEWGGNKVFTAIVVIVAIVVNSKSPLRQEENGGFNFEKMAVCMSLIGHRARERAT